MRIGSVIIEPAKFLLLQFFRLSLKAIGVIIILILGWFVSNLIKVVVVKILKTLKLDLLSEKIGISYMLEKGNIEHTLSEIIGEIIYWIGILITFVVASNAIGLTVLADLLSKLILYVPNIIASTFILILGILLSTFLGNMVKTAASNANFEYYNFLGNIVRIIIIIFSVIISLGQLNINTRILEFVITIIIASIGLAFALAFGLGCKDIANNLMEEFIKKLKNKK